eukprot:TRINITY_DN3642_c1_g2_i1.p1 TRINITY_DN3642_c1_g2~~TRINITY_DN3642_c1_g2_i1.p1  ORF type:complete len:626 (-),score=164.19 TRINITY_DN3642_c1_g2_i1:921-2621(-)
MARVASEDEIPLCFELVSKATASVTFAADNEDARNTWIVALNCVSQGLPSPICTPSSALPAASPQDLSPFIALAAVVQSATQLRQQLLAERKAHRRSTIRSCFLRWAHARRTQDSVRLDAAVERSTTVISQLLDRHAQLQTQFKDVQHAAREQADELISVTASMASTSRLLRDSESENRHLRYALEALERSSTDANERRDAVEHLLDQQQRVLESAMVTKDQHKRRADECERLFRALQEEKKMLQLDRDRYIMDLDIAHRRNQQLAEQVTELNKDALENDKIIARLRTDVSQAQNELITSRSEMRRRDLHEGIDRKLRQQQHLVDGSVQSHLAQLQQRVEQSWGQSPPQGSLAVADLRVSPEKAERVLYQQQQLLQQQQQQQQPQRVSSVQHQQQHLEASLHLPDRGDPVSRLQAIAQQLAKQQLAKQSDETFLSPRIRLSAQQHDSVEQAQQHQQQPHHYQAHLYQDSKYDRSQQSHQHSDSSAPASQMPARAGAPPLVPRLALGLLQQQQLAQQQQVQQYMRDRDAERGAISERNFVRYQPRQPQQQQQAQQQFYSPRLGAEGR